MLPAVWGAAPCGTLGCALPGSAAGVPAPPYGVWAPELPSAPGVVAG